MLRAYTVTDMSRMKMKIADFEGEWLSAFGQPELKGSWAISGNSYQGKTNFSLQLAKYLCGFQKVAYNSLEEGIGLSFKHSTDRVKMREVRGRFLIYDQWDLAKVEEHISKPKAPKIVFFDSSHYMDMSVIDYKSFKKRHPNNLFIWIMHEENGKPEGRLAKKIWYDSDIKIRVEGFVAFVESRYKEGKSEFTIWKEGAEKYHGRAF